MPFSKEAVKGRSVSELEMLTGRWRGVQGDDIFEEYWLPESRGNKACVFRWQKLDPEKDMFEAVIMIERNGEIHMMLRHFDHRFHAWEEKDEPLDFVVTELSPTHVTFVKASDPETGFLHYDLSQTGKLIFRMYAPDEAVRFKLEFLKVE